MTLSLLVDEYDVQQEFKGRDGKIYAQIGFKKGTLYEGYTTKIPYYDKQKLNDRNNLYDVKVSDSFVFHLRKATYDDLGNDKEERLTVDAKTLSDNIQEYRQDYLEQNRVTIDADALFRSLDRGARYLAGYVASKEVEIDDVEKQRIQLDIVDELKQFLNPNPRQQINMVDIHNAIQSLLNDDVASWKEDLHTLYWQVTGREWQNIAYHRSKISSTPEEQAKQLEVYQKSKELNDMFKIDKSVGAGKKL